MLTLEARSPNTAYSANRFSGAWSFEYLSGSSVQVDGESIGQSRVSIIEGDQTGSTVEMTGGEPDSLPFTWFEENS